jgi:hypothetical protein
MANNDSEVDLVQLEKDFKEVEKQVNEKLRLAAQAVSEAQTLAKSKGLSLMKDTDDYRTTSYIHEDLDLAFNVDVLVSAMDLAGWNSSSWNC